MPGSVTDSASLVNGSLRLFQDLPNMDDCEQDHCPRPARELRRLAASRLSLEYAGALACRQWRQRSRKFYRVLLKLK